MKHLEFTSTFCPRHLCRMRYSTKQVKDSGIFTIFVGGGWGGGASYFLGDLEKGQSKFAFVEKGY